MADYDFAVDGKTYKPYLQDGEKHFVTKQESATNYWDSFYGAFQARFPEKEYASEYYDDGEETTNEIEDAMPVPGFVNNTYWQTFYGAFQARFPEKYAAKEEVIEEVAPVEEIKEEEPAPIEDVEVEEEAPVEEAPVEEAPVAPVEVKAETPKKKAKKNTGAIVVGFVASVAAIAVAVLNFFGIGGFITRFFAGKGTKAVYDLVVSVCGNNAGGMFAHGLAAAYIVAGALTVSAFIVGIVALASKKAVKGVGALGLISLIAVIAILALTYICDNGLSFDKDAILCFLNPHVHGVGAVWGLYIGVAALFIETVCGFASYRK